jgi:DUF917 family protein
MLIDFNQAAESNERVESLLRTACVELGLSASIAGRPITGDAVKKLTVPNTLSQSWYFGRAVHLPRPEKMDLIRAIFDTQLQAGCSTAVKLSV